METTSPNPRPFFGKSPLSNPWVYALASCSLLLVLLCLRQITDFDFGYHLRSGQWIAQNHRMLREEIFTFTVSDHPYLDIYWLYQVLLYGFYRLGGYSFLSFLNACLIVTAFYLLLKRAKDSGASLGIRVPLLAAAVLASETRFQIRPEILSWILLGLTLWVLESRERRGKNLLYLLPLIQLAWVNLQGLFILGWVVMGSYLVSQFFHSRKIDKKLLQYGALALVCDLLNPNFLQGVLYPLSSFHLLGSSSLIKQSIFELQSPWTLSSHFTNIPRLAVYAYRGYSFFLLALLMASFKKRKLHDFLIAGAFFYLSATALRNISLFMAATVPLAASCWKDLSWAWFEELRGSFPAKTLPWVFTVLAFGLSLRVLTGAFYISDRRMEKFGLGLNDGQLPVRAADFLVQNRLDGRILNQMNSGGWLAWKGPQKVFIDGHMEVMGEDFIREYKTSNTQDGLAALLVKYRIDIVFFNPADAPLWIMELQKLPDWRVVHLDESGVVYLRKGYAPAVAGLDLKQLLAEKDLTPVPPEEVRRTLQAPRIPKGLAFARSLLIPSAFPNGLLNLANFHSYNEHPEIAEPFYLEAIRRSQGEFDDCYLTLGSMYRYKERNEEAGLCMRRVLERDPDNRLALRILASIPAP